MAIGALLTRDDRACGRLDDHGRTDIYRVGGPTRPATGRGGPALLVVGRRWARSPRFIGVCRCSSNSHCRGSAPTIAAESSTAAACPGADRPGAAATPRTAYYAWSRAWCRWRLSAEMPERPSGDLRQPRAPVHPRDRRRTDTGSDHSVAEVDVVGALFLGNKALVAIGEAVGRLLGRSVLVPGLYQGLDDALEQPRPASVLVVNRTAGVHDVAGPGRARTLRSQVARDGYAGLRDPEVRVRPGRAPGRGGPPLRGCLARAAHRGAPGRSAGPAAKSASV
jgi:hypothetical protein